MPVKICAYCGKEFVPYRPQQTSCSEGCRRVAARTRASKWRAANREWANRNSAEYRRSHPDKVRAVVTRWHRSHPEARRQHRARYRQTHAEEIKVSKSAWHKSDPNRGVMYVQRRRAKKTANGGSYTLEEWQELKAKYDYRCLCCGKREPEIKLTIDHVVPIDLGGANDIANIQPLCLSCNQSKHTKIIDYRPH